MRRRAFLLTPFIPTAETDERYMERAIALAASIPRAPFAAILVDPARNVELSEHFLPTSRGGGSVFPACLGKQRLGRHPLSVRVRYQERRAGAAVVVFVECVEEDVPVTGLTRGAAQIAAEVVRLAQDRAGW